MARLNWRRPAPWLLLVLVILAVVPLAVALTGAASSVDRGDGPLVHDSGRVRLTAGHEWDGKGEGDITEADARAVEELPLAWVGTSFEELHLTAILALPEVRPTATEPVVPRFKFVYGDCAPRFCRPPLEIVIASVCGALRVVPDPDLSLVTLDSGAFIGRPGAGPGIAAGTLAIQTENALVIMNWWGDTPPDDLLSALSSPNGASLGPPAPPACE